MSEPQDDDNKTVLPDRPPWSAAPAASAESDASDDHNALPVGSRVAEFEIKSIIGIGGFGIVYLAHDHSLGRDVALKEYLPSALAFRNGRNVSVKTARQSDTFAAGLSSFINEARILAQFDNPSLVKVYRFWNENGTAYMVMPYYDGPTLKQALHSAVVPPTEQWLKGVLVPLLSALELLHRENYFHRDVAPDNILLDKGKRPILLDFGAARRVIAGSDKALTVILKPGYAPVEQYFDNPDMTQGAWTDIYALAAVMHYAITGQPPVPSVSRLVKDTAVPLAQAGAGRYSDRFLRALDQALSVRPEKRPQSIEAFRELLGLHDPMADDAPRPREGRRMPDRKLVAIGGSLLGVAVVAALVVVFMGTGREAGPAPGAAESVQAAEPKAAPPAPNDTVAAGAQPERQTVPAAAVPPPAALAPAAPAADAKGSFQPLDALAQVYDMRQPDHRVEVMLERTKVRVGKDKLRFRVQSDRPGYLYILMLGTDGQHINLLFPNSLDRENRASGNQPINLPRPGWTMTAGGPPGTNEFIALVSERPRDFSQIGLTKLGPFAEFSLDRLASMYRSSAGTTPILAGTPICDGGPGAPCSPAYGAARFTIEEIN